MADKNKFDDQEYQFPKEEYLDADLHAETPPNREEPAVKPEEEQAARSGALAMAWENHKRIIIIAGVLVVVTTVFGVMRMMHHQPAPAPVAPPAPVVQNVVDPEIVSQLTDLKQNAINNNAAVRQLQTQVQQLTNALDQSRAAQQQLNQGLLILAGQMQQLTEQVKVLSKPKPVAAKPVVKAAPEVVITYQLRAIVPGRAWVVGSDGQSHSVTVGDTLPQYGSVQSINADEGIVITSSGKTIKF